MKADKSAVSAMAFCTEKATDITKDVNKKLPTHASVRRTALKTRNENNLPDALDIKVMKAYEASITDKTFSVTDIKIVENGHSTRIYKPLITQKVCLRCHGSTISKEIQSMITTHYSKDKAVGFEEGSLRGVIVTEIKH
jgi:nitrate reductase cytochrome c-type subunit